MYRKKEQFGKREGANTNQKEQWQTHERGGIQESQRQEIILQVKAKNESTTLENPFAILQSQEETKQEVPQEGEEVLEEEDQGGIRELKPKGDTNLMEKEQYPIQNNVKKPPVLE